MGGTNIRTGLPSSWVALLRTATAVMINGSLQKNINVTLRENCTCCMTCVNCGVRSVCRANVAITESRAVQKYCKPAGSLTAWPFNPRTSGKDRCFMSAGARALPHLIDGGSWPGWKLRQEVQPRTVDTVTRFSYIIWAMAGLHLHIAWKDSSSDY